ncbi:bactofilin family protein [Halobacterium litoreum]|uniref:Polymer-forming cytoskeletal protein n=1 Tax=Halobacterium litoreum TaxID=2039234 RepID=A0ABD5NFC3_9EURY|nr:polymer-forming cytoskeletal protein [Halobacterium litoreum]UHH13352.1 polymer-forming cytoskeletal protein [Halobacterium litoreum]
MTTSRVRALALAAVVLLAVPALVGVAAADERAGGTIVVEEGETVTGGLQATGGTVVVRGTVEGGVEAFAGTVVVDDTGTVEGDLTGAAGSIRVAGTVDGNVQAAAGSVDITDTGVVTGDVETGAGSFVLDGRVDGTVRVGAGSISLGENASVGGDFRYDGDLTRADGATVGGELVQDDSLGLDVFPLLPQIAGWLFAVYTLLLTLAFGAILLVAFPGVSRTAADGAANRPLRTAGWGLLAFLLAPLLAVVLFLSIVGIPLGLLWLFVYVFVLIAAFVWGAYALGAWGLSLADYENKWAALVVGVLGVELLGRIPILGGFVDLAVLLLGLGAVALSFYAWTKRRRGGDEEEEMDPSVA